MGGSQAAQLAWQAGVVAAGLALGVSAMAILRSDDPRSYRPGTPSITAFAFPTATSDPQPPMPEVVPALATEPASPGDAVTAFLQALADGTPDLAYPLLDAPSRRRLPTLASWARAQADRAQPVSFEVGAVRPSAERPNTFEVDVSATHRPSLDATRGLVPARSRSVWLVGSESQGWRVAADPAWFRPDIPAEAAATTAVQAWVILLAECDSSGAAQLQVRADLYGPAGLVRRPCEKRGAWTAGDPVALDQAPDPRVFLAAFGPEVGTWARLVPVHGPESSFLAAVAPIGDGWRVMGVAVDGQ